MSLTDSELGERCREILEASLPTSTRLHRFGLLANAIAEPAQPRAPNPLLRTMPTAAADEGADAPAEKVTKAVTTLRKKVTKKKTAKK